MRLPIETMAAIYELRHGDNKPVPWKLIAREYGSTVDVIRKAISRLERGGFLRF